MGSEASRICGYCGIELSESRMIEHTKKCEVINFHAKRSDGTSLDFDYKGSNFSSTTQHLNAIQYKK